MKIFNQKIWKKLRKKFLWFFWFKIFSPIFFQFFPHCQYFCFCLYFKWGWMEFTFKWNAWIFLSRWNEWMNIDLIQNGFIISNFVSPSLACSRRKKWQIVCPQVKSSQITYTHIMLYHNEKEEDPLDSSYTTHSFIWKDWGFLPHWSLCMAPKESVIPINLRITTGDLIHSPPCNCHSSPIHEGKWQTHR